MARRGLVRSKLAIQWLYVATLLVLLCPAISSAQANTGRRGAERGFAYVPAIADGVAVCDLDSWRQTFGDWTPFDEMLAGLSKAWPAVPRIHSIVAWANLSTLFDEDDPHRDDGYGFVLFAEPTKAAEASLQRIATRRRLGGIDAWLLRDDSALVLADPLILLGTPVAAAASVEAARLSKTNQVSALAPSLGHRKSEDLAFVALSLVVVGKGTTASWSSPEPFEKPLVGATTAIFGAQASGEVILVHVVIDYRDDVSADQGRENLAALVSTYQNEVQREERRVSGEVRMPKRDFVRIIDQRRAQ